MEKIISSYITFIVILHLSCSNDLNNKLIVSIDDQNYNTASVFTDLDKTKGNIIKFELKGYQKLTTRASYKNGSWRFGNFEFKRQITIAIDINSGNIYKLTPDQMRTQLKKVSNSPHIEKDRFYLISVLEPDETSWWRNIIRLKQDL